MSFTRAARLSRAQYNVAVLGVEEELGREIARVFLSQDAYGPFFSKVTGVVDAPGSAAAEYLASLDAQVTTDAKEALATSSIDAIVDVSREGASDELLVYAVKASVRLYLRAEFAQEIHKEPVLVNGLRSIRVLAGKRLDPDSYTTTDATPSWCTSAEDLARSLAELIILWGTGTGFPSHIRIAGSPSSGEGGNENEIVNPGELVWKWQRA